MLANVAAEVSELLAVAAGLGLSAGAVEAAVCAFAGDAEEAARVCLKCLSPCILPFVQDAEDRTLLPVQLVSSTERNSLPKRQNCHG